MVLKILFLFSFSFASTIYCQSEVNINDSLLLSSLHSYIKECKLIDTLDIVVVYFKDTENNTLFYVVRTEGDPAFFERHVPFSFTYVNGVLVTFYNKLVTLFQPNAERRRSFFKLLGTKIKKNEFELFSKGAFVEVVSSGGPGTWYVKCVPTGKHVLFKKSGLTRLDNDRFSLFLESNLHKK